MKHRIFPLALAFLAMVPLTLWGQAAAAPPRVRIDNFEKEPLGWNWVDGREFPGAKGRLSYDTATVHGGKGSMKLESDLTEGGQYVGTFRELGYLKGEDFQEIRLWVKTTNIAHIGVRIVDATDQCHQKNGGIPLAATNGWQEVVMKIPDLVGGEHWGGANDGKWHGPVKGLGFNLGKGAFAAAPEKGSLNIDDIEGVPWPLLHDRSTVLSVLPRTQACRPGFDAPVTYRWEAEPLGVDYKVFVHMLNAEGKMMFQADHETSVPTSTWSGHVEYKGKIYVPMGTPDGEYRIVAGLYRGNNRLGLKTGAGVTVPKGDKNAYELGVVKVDSNAPIPIFTGPKLNLDGYVMTFDDEFKDLSLSESGPGTRWCTATKGNFGDAQFMPQKDGFPFSIVDGILPNKSVLRIEAAKKDGKWRGGIMASADPKGGGFSQKYGYFEMRAKFPSSLGMWPAFWMLGQPALTDKNKVNPELDVVEWYGVLPYSVMSTTHLWFPGGKHTAQGDHINATGLTDAFHTYGAMVDEQNITYYFDGMEAQKIKTPEEAKVPLYMIVNLAMGGGWPIDKAISPSYMYVDYVRAYAKK